MDGYLFYEKQAEGIGAYFLDSLYSYIDSLVVNAGMHPIQRGKYHRLLLKRFPFGVYYRLEDETVLVYAVLGCRSKPAWIREKLNKPNHPN